MCWIESKVLDVIYEKIPWFNSNKKVLVFCDVKIKSIKNTKYRSYLEAKND